MIDLGQGVLNWNRYERVGDRYGCVQLETALDSGEFTTWDHAPAGTHGTLTAEIIETRQSRHIGDMFRGLRPSTPDVGATYLLGTGTLWQEVLYDVPVIGLEPDDGRETDWLDPAALYRCHEQTVRLIFEPS